MRREFYFFKFLNNFLRFRRLRHCFSLFLVDFYPMTNDAILFRGLSRKDRFSKKPSIVRIFVRLLVTRLFIVYQILSQLRKVCRLQRCPSVLHRPVHKLALFIFEIANQPFSFERNAHSDDLCSHRQQRKSTKHVDGLDSKGDLKSAKTRRGNARMGGREESAAILRAQLLSPRPI